MTPTENAVGEKNIVLPSISREKNDVLNWLVGTGVGGLGPGVGAAVIAGVRDGDGVAEVVGDGVGVVETSVGVVTGTVGVGEGVSMMGWAHIEALHGWFPP